MAWHETPYKGGPMVKVAGWPRPLYPPDAAHQGKRPSMAGPDVEAYKRTVSRAGRWPWQNYDQAFSNGFSHGNGPNVRDTGIAGVQRQQHLDATGWVGQKTFNTLRSILCPPGPHEGEPCMDAYSVELVNEAWEMFAGHEPPPPGQGSVRQAALQRATSQIGNKENPAGSNLQPYGKWYGMDGVPWCAIFTSWCYELGAGDIGKDSPSFVKGSYYSFVPYVVTDSYNGRNGLMVTDDPQPGDLCCLDFDWNQEFDHIGLFEYWIDGQGFSTVEGNTSTSSDSNGGQVMRRTRNRSAQGTVFVAVREP